MPRIPLIMEFGSAQVCGLAIRTRDRLFGIRTCTPRRVQRNAGSPGLDGMTVEDLSAHLRVHWPRLREELLTGRYQPQPVKRVAIPKRSGGERELGIPTVLDRFIQQALLGVLQPLFDPTFSDT